MAMMMTMTMATLCDAAGDDVVVDAGDDILPLKITTFILTSVLR